MFERMFIGIAWRGDVLNTKCGCSVFRIKTTVKQGDLPAAPQSHCSLDFEFLGHCMFRNILLLPTFSQFSYRAPCGHNTQFKKQSLL